MKLSSTHYYGTEILFYEGVSYQVILRLFYSNAPYKLLTYLPKLTKPQKLSTD